MRYTELARTGLKISVLGFGGIPIRRIGHAEAVAVVRRAVDLGVTFFDTARRYADSEDKMGEALEGVRDRVVIATKTTATTREELFADLEESLRRLRTGHVDLYQLHNVSDFDRLERVMGPGGAVEGMIEAKASGLIRHLGITSHKREVALKALRGDVFETVMLPFSYLEPEAAEEVLPLCRERGVGFIAMKPFSGGALDTPVQCLKWVLGQGVSVAIPGIGSLAELVQDMAVADTDWTLGAEDLALMEKVRTEVGKTFCRRCDYCRPCSNDIPISDVLHSTSLLRRQGVTYAQNGQYERLVAWVESCSECRECEPRCPYNLAIPDLLRQRLAEVQTMLRAVGWQI